MPLPDAALSSSLMINTRLDSPAAEKASMMIPGFASVLTNSDYIMEKMLKNSKVSNVSGSYLSENKKGTTPGIPLELGNNKVIFGYMFHKGEKMDDSVEEFLTFLKGRLPKS